MTVVTGPPNILLVTDLKNPCFVDVIVKVEAGCVIVTGIVVVTTPAVVIGGVPGITVTADTIPVDMLTIVAAGEEVVIVTTLGFDVPDGVVEIVCVLPGDCGPVGPVTIVRVTIVTPGSSVCEFGSVV